MSKYFGVFATNRGRPRILSALQGSNWHDTHSLHATESFLRSQPVLQLVKKFPAFYGTRRFITAFTSASHLSLSWASSIQSIPPHPTSWRSILILSSHLLLGFPCGPFPSGFPTKTLYASPLPHTSYIPRQSHSSRFYHPHNIWWAVQIIQLLIMQFPPLPCYFDPPRPKYSPQHPILEHPHPTFLPQSQRPSFTPINRRDTLPGKA